MIGVDISFDKILLMLRVVDDKQLFAKQIQRLHLQAINYNWKTHKMTEDEHHRENSQ